MKTRFILALALVAAAVSATAPALADEYGKHPFHVDAALNAAQHAIGDVGRHDTRRE